MQNWFNRVRRSGKVKGSFRRLGADHAAIFNNASPTLLVTFETVAEIGEDPSAASSLGGRVARDRGWSHLCIIAGTETWYRAPEVYAFFDHLVDRDFFDEFERVVFYGAGMGGYAAAAFSVAAPGATVVLVQPQATLDPHVAGWDPRFAESRRLCFTDRYGFAPDMIDAASAAFVIFDPEQNLDAMHAALFARKHVTLLPCRNLGRNVARALSEMQILPSVLSAASTNSLDAKLFHIFYRTRRNYRPYLDNLLARLDSDGRVYLAALLCRNVASRLNLPEYHARAERLESDLAASGQRLPVAARR